MEEIKLLKVDNELNERFLRKNYPELLNGIMAATLEPDNRKTKIQFAESVHEHQKETGIVASTANSSEKSRSRSLDESSNFGSHSKGASIASSVGTFQVGQSQKSLSFVIRSEICESECALERADLNVFEQNMRSQFCELLAEVEEIKLTSQDALHATEMFKDFVVVKGKEVRCFINLKSELKKGVLVYTALQ